MGLTIKFLVLHPGNTIYLVKYTEIAKTTRLYNQYKSY